jgi:hypothetical protein
VLIERKLDEVLCRVEISPRKLDEVLCRVETSPRKLDEVLCRVDTSPRKLDEVLCRMETSPRKLDEVLCRVEISPRNYFSQIAPEWVVSASSPRSATKLLHSHPYGAEVVHKFYDAARDVRLNRVSWYVEGVQAGRNRAHTPP